MSLRVLAFLCAGIAASPLLAANSPATRPPNIVIILADDLGYGDLGCQGHPSIRTPNLDQMAAAGLRFTDFYSAAPVCTPSRAALLTGRLAVRSGMVGRRGVLFPDSKGGLPQGERSLATALKAAGYATAHVGKWHLGLHPGGRPGDHGFDFSLGLPYSNDMDDVPGLDRRAAALPNPPADGWNVPLLENGEVVERPVDQTTLTQRYTQAAVSFIERNRDKPFLLYFAHTFPHVPLFASPEFRGKSRRGIYGDTVEELDWSVGQVLSTLREQGLAENTLVVFTSDNGPWLIQGAQGGSAGLLRDGKGSTWEGGMRVPTIFSWPGRIQSGVTSAVAHAMDLFPTALALAGAQLPQDRVYDGVDLRPLLFGQKAPTERPFFYYRGAQLSGCRLGNYKAHFVTQSGYGPDKPEVHEPPLLYDLAVDPGEQYSIASEKPEILESIAAAVAAHRANLEFGAAQLD
jgi:arylsulfatase A-like enzyme